MEEDVDFITLLTGVKNGSLSAGTYRCVDDADIVVNVDANGFGIKEESGVSIIVLFDEKFTRTEPLQ